MKKVKVWTSIVFALLLVACSPKNADAVNEYKVVVEDGKYYIVFSEAQPQTGSGECVELVPAIYFGSIVELKSDIEDRKLSEKELEVVANLDLDGDGRTKICDLSSLKDVRLPASVTSKVTWYGGERYLFSLVDGTDGVQGTVEIIEKETFEDKVLYYGSFETQAKVPVHTVTEDPDRNATVYEYTDKLNDRNRAYSYTITCNGKTLHIWENYDEEETDSVPQSIRIWGEEDGNFFEVYLKDLKERPSVEWLSQFGMKNYEE